MNIVIIITNVAISVINTNILVIIIITILFLIVILLNMIIITNIITTCRPLMLTIGKMFSSDTVVNISTAKSSLLYLTMTMTMTNTYLWVIVAISLTILDENDTKDMRMVACLLSLLSL